MSLSWSKNEVPWAIRASRSISPKRIPPARLRPCVDAVSFDHGSQTRSSYLDRLSREGVDRSRRSHLEFVQHHVAQALVVHDPDVDVRGELLSGNTGVHWLVAVVVVAGGE